MSVVLLLAIFLIGSVAATSYPLYAGQNIEVGYIDVTNDGDNLYVDYVITVDGWCITETHLHVGEALSDFPRTPGRVQNPIPGRFAYAGSHDCVDSYLYTIPGEWEAGDELLVAAHAVVEKLMCEVVEDAPYTGSGVPEFSQGLRKDGTEVREGRSDPYAILTYDTNRVETDFFSLGEDGWVIIEFDCPIVNGEGPDLMVVEDTWGTYPSETADVYASVDGVTWVLLGEATNDDRDPAYNWQTISYFDLGELEYARFIKVVDTTDFDAMPADGDGFDLNTVVALHDCIECSRTGETETAWAATEPGQTRFVLRGNWATYVEYEVVADRMFVERVEVDSALIGGASSVESLVDGIEYYFVASGTWQNANLHTLDAECRLPMGATEWELSAPRSLRLQVDEEYVEWGTECADDNVYELVYTGLGDPVHFRIVDGMPPVPSWYNDNSGSLFVDIYERLW